MFSKSPMEVYQGEFWSPHTWTRGKIPALRWAPVSMGGRGGGCKTVGGLEEGWGTQQGRNHSCPVPCLSTVLSSHPLIPAALGQNPSTIPTQSHVSVHQGMLLSVPSHAIFTQEWFSSDTERKCVLSKFQLH